MYYKYRYSGVVPFPEHEQDKPYISNHIEDNAGILGPFAARLEAMAQDMMDTLGIDTRIITLRDGKQLISRLSNELFQKHSIGKQAPTGGILILLETEGQQARIEVSYGLDAIFPDAYLGHLSGEQLAPYVSYDASGMAVMDVVQFLREYTLQQSIAGNIQLAKTYKGSSEYKDRLCYLSGGAGAQVDISELPSDLNLKQPVAPEELDKYLPSTEPLGSVESFLNTLRGLVGDPSLELFTAGARICGLAIHWRRMRPG